jgi:drug/metabolite transporter (DMT)-like permease
VSTRHTDNLRRSAAYMIAATALFATMGAMVKHVSAELPNEMVAFFRSAIGFLVLLPLMLHQRPTLRTQRPLGHVLRSLAGLGSMYCFFYAVARLPLAEAVLLNYSAPLFIPFIATLWLKEPMSRRVLFAIGLGFVGVVLILKPGISLLAPVALVALISGVLGAVAMVGGRGLSDSEPTFRIVFYYTLVCAVGSAVPLAWTWKTPATHLWLPILTMGTCASVAHLCMTRAYALAPAAQAGPFSYATVVFAALIGWVYWGEVPDVVSAIGVAIVCAAGVLAIRFGGRRSVPPTELPPAQT